MSLLNKTYKVRHLKHYNQTDLAYVKCGYTELARWFYCRHSCICTYSLIKWVTLKLALFCSQTFRLETLPLFTKATALPSHFAPNLWWPGIFTPSRWIYLQNGPRSYSPSDLM